MRRLLWLWTMAGAAVALAQNGTIEGVVVDSATQSPVRKAQVILLYRGSASGMAVPGAMAGSGGGAVGAVIMPSGVAPAGVIPANRMSVLGRRGGMVMGPGGGVPQPGAAVSDSSGGFVFRDVTPGMYTVQAMHPRYPARPAEPSGAEIEVKAGEAARVSIALTPGASITGRIVDEDGEPLQGCSVQLRSAGNRQQWAGAMGSETSNEKGEYRVYGLQAGRYIAFANCGRPVFQPRPFSAGPPPPPSLGYPVVYYPQTPDASAAMPIELSAGSERSGVDFQMKPAGVFMVTGTVAGFERQANRQLMVTLSQPKEQNAPFGNRGGRVNPETGVFQIQNVFPGSYVLTATQFSPDMNAGMLSARQPVEVTDRPMQVDLVLQRPVDIPGTFVVEGNQEVQVQQLHLSVIPEEQTGPMSPPRMERQNDGSFVLRNTSQGRWVLNVNGPGVYLKSVEAGGRTLEGNVLDTSAGAAGPLRVVVSTRTAKVEARGTPGKMYALFREDGDLRLTYPVVTHADPQGAVRMQGLAPGKYGVYEGAAPDETKRLDTVTVAEDAVVELDLTKRPAR